MSSYIAAELRREVATRADRICEYCPVHEDDSFFGCQVDHVVSEKHGGPTASGNLAYACAFCNRSKGTDVGSINAASGAFVRFYNPRRDTWSDHFRLAGVKVEPLTEIGEATTRILDINGEERLLERNALQAIGRFPPVEAHSRLGG